MRKAVLKGILLLALTTVVVLLGRGQVREARAELRPITYTFDLDVTVSGTVTETITPQTATIYFRGGTKLVRPLAAETDITGWFSGSETARPAGLVVKVKEDAPVGATSMDVEFSGTIYSASSDDIKILVQNSYFDPNESDIYATASVTYDKTTPKFNLIRNFTVPSGYSGVGYALYFKDRVSGTQGWELSGTKNTAITSNNELSVAVNGNFTTTIAGGMNINSWFTGELYKYNELLKLTTTSRLPAGVTAKLKNTIKAGDNTFTIVFSGTPTSASRDLIAFTIPKGIVSWYNGFEAKGDSQGPCKVNNMSGKYSYNIPADDPSEYFSEYVKITYPDASIEAGVPVTEADNLIAEYEIIGEKNGQRVTFKGDFCERYASKPTTIKDISYQTPGKDYYNDCITTYTGLDATIIYVSPDRTVIRARLTGTPRAHDQYPYEVGGNGFVLHPAYNTSEHTVNGGLSGDTCFEITEPTFSGSVTGNVTVTKTEDQEKASVVGNPFTISLGKDTLAMDLAKYATLPLFVRENYSDPTQDNGIEIRLTQAAHAGDSTLHVEVYIRDAKMKWTQKGYKKLAFPKEYLTRMKTMGTKDYYDIEDSRIYEDVAIKEEKIKYIWPTDLTVTGKVNVEQITEPYDHVWIDGNGEEHHESDTRTTGLKVNPAGKDKLYFDLEFHFYSRIKNSYEAGDSVLDFIYFGFSDETKSPFYVSNWAKQYIDKDFKFYDIRTVDAIEAGGAASRTLHLMIDLSEMYPMQECTDVIPLWVKIGENEQTTGITTRYTDRNEDFKFNLTKKGGSGASGDPADKPDIWVNRKDNKRTESYNKTMTKAVSDLGIELPDDCKWVVSVTSNDVLEASGAYNSGKGKKSNIAKASYKSRDDAIVVTAGKTAGIARIWIAAVNKKKAVEDAVFFDVKVGTAPKKLYVTKDDLGEKKDAIKSAALSVGGEVSLFVNADGTELSEFATFTWEALKDNDSIKITPSENTQFASVTVLSGPEDGKIVNASIQITNAETGKKVKVKVPISNSVVSVTGISEAKSLASAAEEAVEEDLPYTFVCSDGSKKTTDKIKVYVTTALEEGKGYSVSNNKFTLSAKSTNVTVKYNKNEGTFKIKAKKKTTAGTKVRVLIAATRADKTVEVFESGVITFG